MIKFDIYDAIVIANKLGINLNKVNIEEFTKGLNVELEHGTISSKTDVTDDDYILTAKIAWAHLNEFPDYYTRLAILEKEAREYWKKH